MWKPLYAPAEQVEIRAVLSRIARALECPAAPGLAGLDATLGSGSSGIALFFAYLHLAAPEDRLTTAVEGWVERAFSQAPQPPSLFTGFAGPAWVLAHLDQRVLDLEGADWSSEVDEALLGELRRADRTLNWDLVKGLAGSGVYWLERLPQPAALEGLRLLIRHLESIAETGGDRITWRYPREAFFFTEDRQRYPEGIYSSTVAHGVTGVLGLLAAAWAAGSEPERARGLLGGGMRWLLDHEEPDDAPSAFPMSYAPDDATRGRGQECRLAWCRGDAGIAATLLGVAQAVREPEWEDTALKIALRSAKRVGEEAGAIDPCLCHGTAGLAHLFNRMYQRCGDSRLADAARFWFGRTLALLRDDVPEAAGCWSWQRTHGSHGDWIRRPEPGFLLGAAGVGLALAAAVSDVEPAWDRVLMASFATERTVRG